MEVEAEGRMLEGVAEVKNVVALEEDILMERAEVAMESCQMQTPLNDCEVFVESFSSVSSGYQFR